jgi:hypothetical protein
MTLVSILALMLMAIAFGKRSPRLGIKQYIVIIVITLLQVLIAIYRMYTMEMPPLK